MTYIKSRTCRTLASEANQINTLETKATIAAKPFLRWSGGKRRLLSTLLPLKPRQYSAYHEPFVGGGCMFFALGAKKAFLSDINPLVTRTYNAIKDDPVGVSNLLSTIPHEKEAFNRLRSMDPQYCSDTETAARLIFLMKSCFNGVYRENRQGRFNTPWGGKVYQLPNLPSLIAIQDSLAEVNITDCDFKEVVNRAECDDFVYLDPPYPQLRYRGEFGVRFETHDIERLIETCNRLHQIGAKVMLSYIADVELASALAQWRSMDVSPSRSVASSSQFRGVVSERVFLN